MAVQVVLPRIAQFFISGWIKQKNDSLIISWPGGKKQYLLNVDSNQIIEVILRHNDFGVLENSSSIRVFLLLSK